MVDKLQELLLRKKVCDSSNLSPEENGGVDQKLI